MKKNRIFTTLLALAGIAAVTHSAKAQTVTYTPGDVLMGFQTTNSLGGSTKTVVVNIGNFQLYRDASSSFTINTFGDLGSVLTSTFGLDWNTRADVYWGIASAWTNKPFTGLGSVSPLNGDPARTFYVGKPEAPVGTQVSGDVIVSGTSQVTITTSIFTFEGVFALQTASAGSNNKIAVIDTSVANSWEDFNLHDVPNTSWTDLNNKEGNFGNGTAGTALDLFRYISTTTGANPTGNVFQGSYEGTFMINDTGVVTFLTQPIPEPSTTALIAIGGAGALVAACRRLRRRTMS